MELKEEKERFYQLYLSKHFRIHSMELKENMRLRTSTLSSRIGYESIQWNWKKSIFDSSASYYYYIDWIHSMELKGAYQQYRPPASSSSPRIHSMELKDWTRPLRYRLDPRMESIQWNWKANTRSDVYTRPVDENPFNGIERRHQHQHQPQHQHPRIHSMELKVVSDNDWLENVYKT